MPWMRLKTIARCPPSTLYRLFRAAYTTAPPSTAPLASVPAPAGGTGIRPPPFTFIVAAPLGIAGDGADGGGGGMGRRRRRTCVGAARHGG
uniref:Phb1 n=1 Tax=Arundo donax TaxID=35708 RepID=A0A0A9EV98_ARUDO